MKSNVVLRNSASGMNLESTVLNVNIVTQKATCMILFVENVCNRKVHNEKSNECSLGVEGMDEEIS